MKKNWKDIIKKRNAAFEKLDDRGKRVKVAKDVIKMLDAKKLIAESMVYVLVSTSGGFTDELVEHLIEGDARCRVCALGGLFISHVNNTDKCTVGDADADSWGIKDRLSGFWDAKNLALIECAFERDREHAENDFGYDEDDNLNEIELIDAAIAFGDQFEEDDERLRAIMNRVIELGEFQP